MLVQHGVTKPVPRFVFDSFKFKVRTSNPIQLVIYFIFGFPFFLQGVFTILLLGILIPIGFAISLIKKHKLSIWLCYFLITNASATVSSCIDIGIMIYIYFSHYLPEQNVIVVDIIIFRMLFTFLPIIAGALWLAIFNQDHRINSKFAAYTFVLVARLKLFKNWYQKFTKKQEIYDLNEELFIEELVASSITLLSAIPLGLLTIYQYFAFREISYRLEPYVQILRFGTTIFDAIGLCYFFYFIFFGLENKLVFKKLEDESERQPINSDIFNFT